MKNNDNQITPFQGFKKLGTITRRALPYANIFSPFRAQPNGKKITYTKKSNMEVDKNSLKT